MNKRSFWMALVIVVIGLSMAWGQKPGATTKDAQQPKTVVDYEADQMTKVKGDSTIRMVGNVVFHHNGTIIQCDSAYRYDNQRMDCFGKVIVNKDSAYIYGDKVSYNGNIDMAEVFAPIVKILRGDVTLYSFNLLFNTKTSIGVYSGGGVLTQKDNVMESINGEYNADSNVVKFLDRVEMRSDTYKIKTDSLSYDLDREVATFLTRTYVWDKDSNFLTAERGHYFNKRKTYEFTLNSYVMSKGQELWGDTMSYYQTLRQATMVRNVQILDTANRTIAFGDWGFYDDSLGNATLTRMPSVRSYNEKKNDTTFMRADSIFMFTLPDSLAIDSLPQDSLVIDSMPPLQDSTVSQKDSLVIDSMPPLQDSTVFQKDSIVMDSIPQDSIVFQKDVEKQQPRLRILKAYHDVRAWGKQAQMVCDSTVGYSKDSMAILYGQPILWNDNNQITSAEMYIYSLDEQMDWADCLGDPFITQAVKPLHHEPADTSRFNQAQGKRLQVYFKNNELDSAVLIGNVMNYYYMDNEGYTSAFATISCPSMAIFFENQDILRIRWDGQKDFVFYPLDKIPATQPQRLKGFSWSPELRPTGPEQICTRELKPSMREVYQTLLRPTFQVQYQFDLLREKLTKEGTWQDRQDVPSLTPDYFLQRTFML